MKALFARTGRLPLLAAAALVALSLAGIALHGRILHHIIQTRQPVFASLGNNLARVTGIHIRSRDGGDIDIAFLPNHGWVVRNRGNYPASYEMVSRTLRAMAALTTTEPKTARPEWYSFIHLDAPPAGKGTLIFLTEAHGKALASLIVGKKAGADETAPEDNGTALFIRKPDEKQSWLAYSPADLHSTLTDWLDRTLIDIAPTRISEIDFQPLNSPPFAVRREPTGLLTLAIMPQDKPVTAMQNSMGQLFGQLSALTIADVVPISGLDFTGKAIHVLIRSADGLMVGIDVISHGASPAVSWARIGAAALPGHPAAADEARRINARTFNWAFRLTDDDATALTATVQTLRE